MHYFSQCNINRNQWSDKYSPNEVLGQCGLACLCEFQTVDQVHPDADGSAGDLNVYGELRGGEGSARFKLIGVQGGVEKLRALRALMRQIYSQPCREGGRHWGSHEDIAELSQVLGIGFLVFSDQAQGSDSGWFPMLRMHAHLGVSRVLVFL